MLPIILYSDDTSGNKSKKWHKVDTWCVLLAGLPQVMNAQFSNIHFMGCSDTVSFLEMSEPIATEVTQLEIDGLEAYDAYLKQSVLVIAPAISGICGNLIASEMVNHLGGTALRFCRICRECGHNTGVWRSIYHAIKPAG